jgi:hypothetical protein
MMHACVAPYKIASLYEGLAFCGHVLKPDLILGGFMSGTDKNVYLTSAFCHECDSASGARPYVPAPLMQFFEIA